MLDTFRFVLALCVFQAHLLVSGIPWLGWQAVFSFYVLSGFLMTMVLNEHYGFGLRGGLYFVANRILRIFPAYWLVIGIAAIWIAWIGPLNQLNSALRMPIVSKEILANLLLFGSVGFDSADVIGNRLAPSAWSLNIELVCYLGLAIFFGKSVLRLAFLTCLGFFLTAWNAYQSVRGGVYDYGFYNHYVVIQAGIFPFGIGGMSYFLRQHRWFRFSVGKLFIVFALYSLNCLAGSFWSFHKYVSGLLLAAVLCGLITPMLFGVDKMYGKRKWQELLGGAAYPLFISHWMIGTAVFLYSPVRDINFSVATIFSVLFALLVYIGLERPMAVVRKRVRDGCRRLPPGKATLPSVEPSLRRTME